MEGVHRRSNTGVKKRSPNACERCRRQKIKCSGTKPCATCSKRSLACTYDNAAKKVLVTKRYLEDLVRRAEQVTSNRGSDADSTRCSSTHDPNVGLTSASEAPAATNVDQASTSRDADLAQHDYQTDGSDQDEGNGIGSPDRELVNPLIMDSGSYLTDHLGRQIHIGTSSNWAFARRVLSTACERLGLQVPVDPYCFEETIYNLDWGLLMSGSSPSHEDLMPSYDYAVYLINAAKFHCGQMFHLFDDTMFMQHFATFHASEDGKLKVPRLWYTHYLVLIALAKLLVARNFQSSTPPVAELFLQAMKSWPELIFGSSHVVECVEVLICAALYLQCLDFRSAAFIMIGQAVRKALGQGLHTPIRNRPSDGPVVQRCRRIWWTIYILDRQMSMLVGLPQAIRDEDISAPYPLFNTFKESIGLEIHVKLSQALADTVNTVYSTDGRLPRKFLTSTKQALQNIAKITDLLSRHIEMPKNLSRGGVSRFAAYLHLLNHQCICLTTRPVALSYLDRRLQRTADGYERTMPRGSAQVLLKICINSAQQMLHILSALRIEGILESFLPFDLEATFIASMILIMAKVIDEPSLEGANFWTQTSYSILDDMHTRGNMIALARKRELQQLVKVLEYTTTEDPPSGDQFQAAHSVEGLSILPDDQEDHVLGHMDDSQMFDEHLWPDDVTADQLRELAHSLDLDSLSWMTASQDDPLT